MFIQAFLEGIVATLGALILELSLPVFGFKSIEGSLYFFLFTAGIEEILKFAFIYNHYQKIATKEKILANAFFIGLGFALTDVLLKSASYEKNMLWPISGVFLVHILTAISLGLFFLKKNQKSISLSLVILSLNIFFHFFYNFLILLYL